MAEGPPAACPPALALKAPPRTASGVSPQLVEHSGDLRPPLPWVAAESALASPASPLLVLLHGRGDSPERFVQLGHELASRLPWPVRVVAARAPIPLGVSGGRQWFGRGGPDEPPERPEEAMAARVRDLEVLLGRLRETYPEAPPPILIGFSQGAMVALHFAASRGQRPEEAPVGGIVALSGQFAAPLSQDPPPSATSTPRAPPRPPLLIVAGESDAVVPATRSWEATAWFAERGFPVTCHAFAGTHRVPPEVLDAVAGWVAGLPPQTPK